MEKYSTVLTWGFLAIVIASVGFTFYKTVILEDFVVVYCDEEECYDEIPAEWLVEGEEYLEDEAEYHSEEMLVDESTSDTLLEIEEGVNGESAASVFEDGERELDTDEEINESL